MRLTLATILATLTLAVPAPAQAGALRCDATFTRDNRHTVGKLCNDGLNAQYGGKFAIDVEFCGASGCWRARSPKTTYGSTAFVHSDYGTFTSGSLNVIQYAS